MDTDICEPDVDKSFHMLVSTPHSDQKDFYSPTPSQRRYSDCV